MLYLDGSFDRSAPVRLSAFIAEQGIDRATVYFNSPGGSLISAMAIGRLLRERQFDTRVGRRGGDPRYPGGGVCYSACPFAFAGGRWRYLDSGATIGIHRIANRVPVADEAAFDKAVAAEATAYLAEMGVSAVLLRLMARVPHDGIRVLSHAEAARLGLTRPAEGGAASPPRAHPR